MPSSTHLCVPPNAANNSGVNKRQITDLVDQSIQINTHCFVVTADNRYILVCGFWDKSFRVYSTETGELIQSLPVSYLDGVVSPPSHFSW